MAKPPQRIQLSRRKGSELPANTVVVARPTVWGNPFKMGEKLLNGETLTRAKSIDLYEQHVLAGDWPSVIRLKLQGKNLACWCPLTERCHGDVLLKIANEKQV